MVISKQGGVQLVQWSYRSKSGWVWLIPLSSPNDAAVEESSSKMRLFQKFSRCGWCWKFFKGAAVPEVLSKVRMMAEGSSKTRLFQKYSQRYGWWLKVPQRRGCSRSALKGASDAENAPRGGSVGTRTVYFSKWQPCEWISFTWRCVLNLPSKEWCDWFSMHGAAMVSSSSTCSRVGTFGEEWNLSAWCGSFNAWCGCLHFLSQWFSSRPRMVPLHPLIFRRNALAFP